MVKNRSMAEAEILDRILFIRSQRVMVDADLARLYGVETKRLKEQVRRNMERFPEHYMFELSREEAERSRSQIATLNKRGENIKYLPFAFTEHGILMLANVLNSKRAIQMSIRIIDLFVQMRSVLQSNKDVLLKVESLEHRLGLQSDKMGIYERELQAIIACVKELLDTGPSERRKIGYEIGKEK